MSQFLRVEIVLLHNPADAISWTDAENNDMFWKCSEALAFLSNWGVRIHYPTFRGDVSGVNRRSWLEACNVAHSLHRTPEHKTIFVCLRAENWWREGLASGIGGDFALLSYRAQYGMLWSIFTAMVAHEFLHLIGATDQYENPYDRNIMSDLSSQVLNVQTSREIGLR
ncbi:MAG: hypothetical protein A2W25_15425 [candidate division Zixibacteria bacterium RBG_16_53_22]|nr:MAG: hypothetical protein A2W25_15425 [candidate division Zixibacteria bacterium RBG_16_53_22]